MKKEERKIVYDKYNGHCAYCGKKIEYKEMQVDHLIPKRTGTLEQENNDTIECMENYMPSCKRCNHYKRANSLETFRRWISEIPNKLSKEYITNVGLDYGLVEFHPKRVEFFFEKWDENGQVARKPVIKYNDSNCGPIEYDDEYRCPTCGNLVGYKGYSFDTKLTDRCKECGRLIDWQ